MSRMRLEPDTFVSPGFSSTTRGSPRKQEPGQSLNTVFAAVVQSNQEAEIGVIYVEFAFFGGQSKEKWNYLLVRGLQRTVPYPEGV